MIDPIILMMIAVPAAAIALSVIMVRTSRHEVREITADPGQAAPSKSAHG